MATSTIFWESFWPNFWADFVVLLIASVLFPFFLQWRNRPKVTLVNSRGRSRRFSFTQSEDNHWETTLNMAIKNFGRKTLEKYFWEIYIENTVPFDLEEAVVYEKKIPTLTEVGKRYTRIYGYMEVPLFPLDDLLFPYRIKIKTKEKRPITLYYFFRTEYGMHPFYAWIGTWRGWMFLLKKIIIQ